MKILPPYTITSDQLTSNVTITETEWVAGTYNTGDQRYVGTTLYEVVAIPSTTDEPTVGAAKDIPTWIEVGSINKFKMFDFIIGSKTTRATPIDVTLDTDKLVNGVALFDVDAAEVQVIVTDPTDGEVYNQTKSLNDNAGVNNMYQYFFAPIVSTDRVLFDDLPAYATAEVRVIASKTSGDVAIGELIVGKFMNIGSTLQNFEFGIEDFSRKERNEFGDFIIIERRFAQISTYDVYLENSEINTAFKSLANVRATPTVYVGRAENPETIALGFYRDFSVLRRGPNSSEMTLEIEGLT